MFRRTLIKNIRRQWQLVGSKVRFGRMTIASTFAVSSIAAASVWGGCTIASAESNGKRLRLYVTCRNEGGKCNVLTADSEIINRLPDLNEVGSYVKFTVVSDIISQRKLASDEDINDDIAIGSDDYEPKPDSDDWSNWGIEDAVESKEYEDGERFVVFIDGSNVAKNAIRHALSIKKPGDQLYLVHLHRIYRDDTILPGTLVTPRFTSIMIKDTRNVIEKMAHTYGELLSGTDNYELSVMTTCYLRETAARVIRELGPTHIFCGSRNLGFLRRMLSGSFSHDLLDKTSCSITIVKDEEPTNMRPVLAESSRESHGVQYLTTRNHGVHPPI